MSVCKLRRLAGVATLLVLTLAGCGTPYPFEYLPEGSGVAARCFTATGHTVRGNFLRYFEVMGGVESLGYPLTEAIEQEGRQVQYFEYARLEDHPDNPGRPTVKLSMLGERLERRRPPLSPERVPPDFERRSRYYPQVGHAIHGDFLQYFDRHGGLDRFGFPIAEPLLAEGQLVQDFQRVRLVWNLDRRPDDRVTMEPSGRVYFETQGLDSALLASVPCPPGSEVVRLGFSQPVGPSRLVRLPRSGSAHPDPIRLLRPPPSR